MLSLFLTRMPNIPKQYQNYNMYSFPTYNHFIHKIYFCILLNLYVIPFPERAKK